MGRRALITEEIVFETADALYEATGNKIAPTVEDLRGSLREQGLGKGGSNDKLAGFLRAWKRKNNLLPEEEYDPVIVAAKGVHAQLERAANARIESIEAAAQERVQAAEQDAQQLRAETDRVTAALREQDELLAKLQDELQAANNRHLGADSARAALASAFEALSAKNAELAAGWQRVIEQALADRATLVDRAQAAQESFGRQVRDAINALRQEQELFTEKASQFEARRQELQGKIEAARTETAVFKTHLADKTSEFDSLAKRFDETEATLRQAQTEAAALSAINTVLTERLAAQDKVLAQVEGLRADIERSHNTIGNKLNDISDRIPMDDQGKGG